MIVGRGAVRDANGVVVCEGANTRTDAFFDVMIALMAFGRGSPLVNGAAATLAELAITKIQLGNAAAPTAPARGDTALSDGTPFPLTSLTFSYPARWIMRVEGALPADSTLVGTFITELGVFVTVGVTDVLLARVLLTGKQIVAAQAYACSYELDLTAMV